ncbi:MAG TPA: phosphohydrolase [Firmicutes bacterium]|jgi:predicted HD superfamily hydrolase involved in NAD metabolism|nr:phosphohydrolase [Bacillota bacterium]
MNRPRIIEKLSGQVSEKRLAHCLRVESTALKLAPRFGVEPELVTPAALLHDFCREYPEELLLKLAANFGIVIDDIERKEPILLHGAVAAALVRAELGIDRPDILEAITLHITGGPGISNLTKVVYIADFIEPGRAFPAAVTLREESLYITPELLLLKVYNRTLNFLVARNYLIHPLGNAGRNELIMKGIVEN